MNVGEMLVRFAADTGNFSAGVAQVGGSLSNLSTTAQTHLNQVAQSSKSAFSTLMDWAKKAYFVLQDVQMGYQMITGVIGPWIQGAIQAQQNQSALNAVLKSTHDAVGMSATQINAMVQSLKNLDGVDDDVILSGTNMLLTFTNIGSSVFPMANQAMLDMAVAMNHGSMNGLDLKDTAIQLGKALNDPINGITALSRVGVTFTEQQKEQIKAMVAAGNTAGAQKLILKELEREFGGAAKAAGDADPFNKFKLAMGDIGKTLGAIVLPPLTTLANFITPLANQFLQWLQPAIQGTSQFLNWLGQAAQEVFAPLGQLWQTVQGLAEQAFKPLSDFIQQHVAPAFQGLKAPIDAVSSPILTLNNYVSDFAVGLQQVILQIQNGSGEFGSLKGVFQTLGQAAGQVFQLFKGSAISDFGSFSSIVQTLSGAFTKMLPGLLQFGQVFVSSIVPAAVNVIGALLHIRDTIMETLAKVLPIVMPLIQKLATFLEEHLGKAIAFLGPKITEAAHTVSGFADAIATRIVPAIQNVVNFIQTVLIPIWSAAWPGIEMVFKGAWDFISGIIEVAWSTISGMVEIILDLFGGNWGQAFSDLKDMLSGIWDGIVKIFSGVGEAIGGYFKEAFGVISMIWGHIWDWVSGRLSAVWNWITTLIGSWAGWIGARFDQIKSLAINIWNNIVNGIRNAIQTGFNWVKQHIQEAINFVVGLFNWLYQHNTYFKLLVDKIREIIGDVVTWLQTTWQHIVETVVDLWNSLKTKAEVVWAAIKAGVEMAWNWVKQHIITPVQDAWNWVTGKISALKDWLASKWSEIGNDARQLWDKFTGAISSTWSNVTGWIHDHIVQPIEDTIKGLINNALDWGKNLINMFIQGIESKINDLKNTLSNVASNVGKFLGFHSPPPEGPAADSDTWAPNFVNMLIEGLDSSAVRLAAAAANVASQLQQPFLAPQTTQQIAVALPASPGQTNSSSGTSGPITINLVAKPGGAPLMSWFGPELVAALRNAGVKL